MYTIVVADDEEELRRAIIRKIDWESTGFRVVGEAENGIEALELVERMEPDLLLTDIRMPFVSGIELARQVREVRPTTQIAGQQIRRHHHGSPFLRQRSQGRDLENRR